MSGVLYRVKLPGAYLEVTRLELVITACKAIVLPAKLHPHPSESVTPKLNKTSWVATP